ncbi:MAG: hypothetical protein MJ210_02790 [Alphaproteobacteria bacterium]|nr:hypothetical protein [Alphaproteobacteria bacterium]
MKKTLLGLVFVLFVTGCIRAGDYDLFPVRKKVLNAFSGYSIETKKQGDELVGRETKREHTVVLNKALTVKKGEPILSDKTYNSDSYRNYVYRPTKKGVISTIDFSMSLVPDKKYTVLGWTDIDGVQYSVLDSGLDDYAFLFDDNGKFFSKAGRIIDGRIHLLNDEDVFIYPSDNKMLILVKMREDISNIKNGYEVKYGGVELDRIWFDYMEYDQTYNEEGRFERLNFPNKPGLIMINGIGLRVLRADGDSLTYMVLKDNN